MDRLRFKKTHLPYNRNKSLLALTAGAFTAIERERAAVPWKAYWGRVVYFTVGFAVFCSMVTWGLALGITIRFVINFYWGL